MPVNSSRHAVAATLSFGLLFAAAGCAQDNTGALSDGAYRYCTTEATAEEQAAANALNLQVGPEAFADGTQAAGDPVFAQACEYAYQARPGPRPRSTGAAAPSP